MKLIAETAWHHQGEFEFMRRLVAEIGKRTEADIIKFHLTLDMDEYMAPDHPLYNDLKKWIFSRSQWAEIIESVGDGDKEIMLLFNDTESVEFGMAYDPGHVEIHSVCLNDVELLAALRDHLDRETRVVLGVGGSSVYEIENAVNILRHPNIVLMFGFQNYPTKFEDINFSKMRRIMKLYPEYQFGYADHTAWDAPDNILITILGAALGMDYIEKHVTISYGEERADWSAAVSIDMFNEIREKMDFLELCNGDGLLRFNKAERDYSEFGLMKKAALSKVDLKAGEKMDGNIIDFKRTGRVSDMSQVEVLENLGKEIKKEIKAGDVLMREHF